MLTSPIKLLAYDEDDLKLPEKGKQTSVGLDYKTALQAIASLKTDLAARGEATDLFGMA